MPSANKYWVSPVPGVWSLAGNWSLTSGGAGGAGAPTATEAANFDGNGDGNCVVDTNVSVESLLFSSGSPYVGTISYGANAINLQVLEARSGTHVPGASTWNIIGRFDLRGCSWTGGAETFEIFGFQTNYFGTAVTGDINLNDASTFNLGDDGHCNNFTANAGILNLNGYRLQTDGAFTVNYPGRLDKTTLAGSFLAVVGAFSMNGTEANPLDIRATATWDIQVVASPTNTIAPASWVNVAHCIGFDLPITATDSTDSGNNTNWIFVGTGTNYWLSDVPGLWSLGTNWSLGHAPLAGEDVVFNSAHVGNCIVNAAAPTWRSLYFETGYTGTVTWGASAPISRSVNLSGGTHNMGTSQWSHEGDWFEALPPGQFIAGTSRISFDSSATCAMNSRSGAVYADIDVNCPKLEVALDLIFSGTLRVMDGNEITAVDLYANGGDLQVGTAAKVTVIAVVLQAGGQISENDGDTSGIDILVLQNNGVLASGTYGHVWLDTTAATVTFGPGDFDVQDLITTGGPGPTVLDNSVSNPNITVRGNLDLTNVTYTPGTGTVTLAAPEPNVHASAPTTIATHTELGNIVSRGTIPDGPAGVMPNVGADPLKFFFPAGGAPTAIGIVTGSIADPTAGNPGTAAFISSLKKSWNYNNPYGGPIWVDSVSGMWLMFYHADDNLASPSQYWDVMGLAKSLDNGATWTDLGYFVTPGLPLDANMPLDSNNIGPNGFAVSPDGLYFYHYFDDVQRCGPGYGFRTTYFSVARALLADVVSDALNDIVTPWYKWNGTDWSEPAIGGRAAPLGSVAGFFWDVTYHTDSGKYILVGGTPQMSSRYSDDGINWRGYKQITGSAESVDRNDVVCLIDANGNVSRTATGDITLMYVHGHQWDATELRSRTLTFEIGTQTITLDGNTLEDVVVDAAGATKKMLDTFRCGILLIVNGTVDVNSQTLAVDGDMAITYPATVTGMDGTDWTVEGNLNLQGASGVPLLLNPASAWFLTANGTTLVRYATVKNSDASGGNLIEALDSTDQGSNDNWNFAVASSVGNPFASPVFGAVD